MPAFMYNVASPHQPPGGREEITLLFLQFVSSLKPSIHPYIAMISYGSVSSSMCHLAHKSEAAHQLTVFIGVSHSLGWRFAT